MNQFALKSELTYVDLQQTLLLAMPFNFLQDDQNPSFGMSTHLLPIVTEHWLSYKVVLRDKYGNALLRKYEYLNTVQPFTAELINESLQRDINFKFGNF